MNSKTLRSPKSKFLLSKGKAVWYDWYDYPNGSKWIVKYRGRYFKIVHDGTANEFFHSHAPIEIDENEAKQIISGYEKAWEEAIEKFGWETLEEYFERIL